MQRFDTEIIKVTEGTTKILVPKGSIYDLVPPKNPAFFNPRARLNRDISVVAYSAFVRDFKSTRIFLDGLSGLGARGLRVANEVDRFEDIVLNDLNPKALELASESAIENKLDNVEISKDEVCRFLAGRSKEGRRGTITDIDPFGSPAKFLDCGMRATIHGGMLSVTATDLQVLNGLFQTACMRRYGGTPIRTEFGNEIAIRLVLGCLRHIADRLDMEIQPLFVESDQHYYRAFVRVLNRNCQDANTGFLYHCKKCGDRGTAAKADSVCRCNNRLEFAGPLWTGQLFEKQFVHIMESELEKHMVDKACSKIIKKAALESEMPATYYTLDEVASKLGISPPGLDEMIKYLHDCGYSASPTSLRSTGFRTDARMDQIRDVLAS